MSRALAAAAFAALALVSGPAAPQDFASAFSGFDTGSAVPIQIEADGDARLGGGAFDVGGAGGEVHAGAVGLTRQDNAPSDAHLEVASSDDRIHVESDTHPCEERGHPEHCAICQFLRGAIVSPRAEPTVPIVATATLPPAAHDGRAATRASLPTLPRGPPLFS